ncbi:MAG: DUF481 domain-containing protein [Planctomycetota bacterium]
MRRSALFLAVVGMISTANLAIYAQEEGAKPKGEPVEEPSFDEVVLKNGSKVIGRIVDMGGGSLSVETAFGIDTVVKVKWDEVQSITTGKSNGFLLDDGSLVKGKILRTEDGVAVFAHDRLEGEGRVELSRVTAINPPKPKDVELIGSINFGGSAADGNTQTKTASLASEAVAQTERQRLSLNAYWNYAEDSVSGLTARNTKGGIKYDFFVSDRTFIFASAFFEEDIFQDLNLRTALSAGPGYQFVKKGELSDWLEQLEMYGEAGLAFFNEDFRAGADNRYLSARWAIRADLPIYDRITLFHRHEGYPGLEDLSDLYIRTEQGIRFSIWENFIATFQVNWRWDNTPSPGFERSDTQYLFTLGYQFTL